MANKVNGWLRQRMRADGMTWLWCHQRLRPSDGKMVENSIPLGMVAEIGDESAAWFEVWELRLVEKQAEARFGVNPMTSSGCIGLRSGRSKTGTNAQVVVSDEDRDGGRYRIRIYAKALTKGLNQHGSRILVLLSP